MADYGGAVLPLSIDDSALKRSLTGTLSSFKAFGSQVDGVMANLGRFTIAATGLYALKKAFDATTGAALSFNQQLKATWAVAGDLSRGELRALGGEVRSLARQFNMTATEAQHAMYEINQSVFYGADALVILKESAKGAAAGMTDVYTVADMMTTVLNAYGMAAEKSAHVNDVLFQTVLYGKVTMNELASEFGRLAGVAAPVGASLEEVSAAIATLTRLGIDTDTAVTAIRQSLFQILRPSKALKTAITALGYTTGRAMVESLGFAQSLQALVDYGNSAGVEMETLFSNIRAVLAILPLTSTAAGEYADDLLRVGNSAGAADTAFKKITSSWLYQIQNLKVILNDLAVSFGQLLVPAIQAFLKTMQALLTPLAHVAEFLGQIGGQQTVALVTTVGALSLAFGGFVKILNAVRLAMWGLIEAEGALYTAGRFLFKAPINFGMNASIPKGLGLAALGAFGIGAAIKGLTVDLPIYLDPKVTGAEKTKAKLKTALETGLGSFLGGAIFAKMLGATFGGAVAAGIGAGLFTATIGIYIAAEIVKGKQAAEEAAAALAAAFTIPKSKEEIEKERTKAAVEQINIRELLPFKIADSIREASKGWEQSSILAVVEDLIKANEYLSSFKGKERNFLVQQLYGIVDAMYETEVTVDDFGNRIRKLRTDFEDAATSPDTLSTAIDDFANQYRALAKLSGAPAIVKDVASEIDMARYSFTRMWDQLKAGNLTGEEATKKWEEINAVVDYWADKAEIAEAAGWKSAAAIRAFSDELNAFVEVADATWASQIAGLATKFKTGTMEEQIAAQQGLESLGKSLLELAENPSYSKFKEALLALVTDIEDVGIRLGDVANPLAEAWKTLSAEFSTGQIDLDTFITKLRESALTQTDFKSAVIYFYQKMNELSGEMDEGVSAQQFFQVALNLSEDNARALASAFSSAESAVESFANKLSSVNISGFVSGINSLLATIGKSITAARDVGDIEGILAGYEAIAGTGDMKERLERVFNTQWAVESMTQEQYDKLRTFYAGIGDYTLGKTNAELQDEANRQAEEAASAATSASEDACQAAEDAVRAQEEAFRAMFDTPIVRALRSGDFTGAANEIQGLSDRFHELAAEAAPLGISATDLISMIQGAKSGLESAIDGLISINAKYPEMVRALEAAKKKVQDVFVGSGSELQKAASALAWEDVADAPGEAAEKLRAFAQEDLAAASKRAEELSTALTEQITLYKQFGYDTVELAFALEEFKAGLEGISPLLADMRYAMAQYVDEVNALIAELMPGRFGQFLAKLISLAGKVAGAKWGGPQLAEGGITIGQTLAMVGESGPEAIIPLDQLPSLAQQMGWAPGGFSTDTNLFSNAGWATGSTYGVTDTFGNVGDVSSVVSEANALASAISAAVSSLIAAIRSARQAILSETGATATGALPSDFAAALATMNQGPFANVDTNVVAAQAEEITRANQEYLTSVRGFTDIINRMQSDPFALVGQNVVADQAAAMGIEPGFPQGRSVEAEVAAQMARWEPFTPETAPGIDTAALGSCISKAITDAFAGVQFNLEMPDETKAPVDRPEAPSVGEALKTMWSGLKGMFTKGGFTEGAQTLLRGIGQFSESGGLGALTAFVSAIKFVTDLLINNWKQVMSDLRESFDKTVQTIGSALGKVYQYLRALPDIFARLVSVSGQLVAKFTSLVQNTEVYSRLQSALQSITSKIFDALLGFLWPIVYVLEKLLGTTEEVNDSFSSLNVPSGYKVTRAEWKAATPGEPGVSKDSTGEYPAWLQKIIDKFSDAIDAVIKPFKEFFALLGDIWQALAPAILEGVLPALKKFGEGLLSLATEIKDNLLPLLEKHLPGILEGSLNFIFGYITGIATFFVKILEETIANLEPFAQELGKIGDQFPALFSAVAAGLDKPLNELIVTITGFAERINSDLIPALLDKLPTAVEGIADLIFGYYEGIGEVALSLTQQLLPSLTDFAVSLGGIGDQLQGLGASFAEAFGPVLETIVVGLTGFSDWISGTFLPDLQEFFGGFSEWWASEGAAFFQSEVFSKIAELGQVVYDWLKDFVGFIRDEIAPWATSDLWSAFEGVLDRVIEAFQGIWQTIKDNWGPISEWLIAQIEKWGERLVGTAEKAEVLGLAAIGEFWQAQHTLWESESISLWDKLKISFGIGLQQVLDVLGPHLTKLGEAFGELLVALQPVWEILGGALLIALKGLTVVIDIITGAFKVLKTIIDIILWPFKLIGGVLKWLFGGGDTEDEIEVDASSSATKTNTATVASSSASTSTSPSKSTGTAATPTATTGAWSAAKYYTGKWSGSTVYQMLSEMGVGASLANSIAGAWAGTGLSEMTFVGILGSLYNTGKFTKAALKSALSSGKSGSYSWEGFTVPGLKKGGFTLSEGLAYLHKHEYVLPAKTASLAAAGVGGITLESYVMLDGRVAAKAVNKVNAARENRATGGPGGRRWQ